MPSDGDSMLLGTRPNDLEPPVTTRRFSYASPLARLRLWIRQHFHKYTQAWWTWEITAAIVSLTALMVLFIVLAQADQKLQQSWAVAGTQLTLNTIVAAIGTVMRTSLYIVVAGALNQSAWNWFAAAEDDTHKRKHLHGRPLKDLETFGEAAANSWNCLKLLWRTRCRYLISIGAVVMILTIGFDTFLQQVLSTEQRTFWAQQDNQNLTSNSNIPRAQDLYFTDTTTTFDYQQSLELQALQTSWLANGGSSIISPACPGESCIWPVTPTLGICHECDYATPIVNQSSSATCANITTYSFDASGTMDVIKVTTMDCGELGLILKSTEWSLYSISGQNHILSNSSRAELTSLYLFGSVLQEDSGVTNGTLPIMTIPPVVAFKCILYFCVQGFQAQTSAGRTIEAPIETKSFDFRQASPMITNAQGDFINIPIELNAKAGDRFRLSADMVQNLQYVVGSFLSGQGSSSIYNTTAVGGDDWATDGGEIDGCTSDGEEIDIGDMFWRRTGSLEAVNELVGNYVSGLTSYLRNNSSLPADSYYAPDVERLLPVVIVRWPWLAYPLFLQVSGLAFLFLIMWETRHCRILAWKGHRVALLLANLDESLRIQARGGLASRTGLDDRVGEALVRLDFDGEDGIVFRRADRPLSKEADHVVHDNGSPPASDNWLAFQLRARR